ncbi:MULTISPECIES: T6SS immunity protein Tli4 family protein [Duganella]|uniref:T6SS immunity protein Tli4 family protein n=1 Tax=Duganella TaxID=75654 RepID=UPI0030E98DC3
MKLILSLIFLVAVVGCDAKRNEHVTDTKMNSVMKTNCIGHSLIDLPEMYALKAGVSATFTPDQNQVEDGYIDLVVEPQMTAERFKRRVGERHAELADDARMTSRLSQVSDMPADGKMFRTHVIEDAYRSEAHWMLNDVYLVASIKSFKNQVAEAETMLLDFVHNVESQRADTTLASFCLGGVTVKGKYRSELASFHFATAQVSDTVFSVDVNTYEKDDKESLLQRLGGPNSLFKKFGIKESVLRKGEKNVAGMRAQEWASVIRPGEKGSEQDLSFLLETMRPVPSATTPRIHMEMDVTGPSARDETAALALWDSVIKTVRPR